MNRINKLQKILNSGEAALITSGVSRRYYTGFPSSAGTVLITCDKAYFLIDFRYFEKAKSVVKTAEVVLATKLFSQITELAKAQNVSEIFVETDSVTMDEYKRYKNALSDFTVSSDEKVSLKTLELRSIKEEEEIAAMKEAQRITDEAFSYILTKIKPGVTEKEIALDMEFFMRRLGSEEVAFDFIVVSGKNSSLPHGVPTDKKIEKGDFVTMDFGATVNGYRSDMTRTVAVGYVSEEQRLVYETVLKAQLAGLASIKAGVKCCDVDKASRDIIQAAGYGERFGHGTGHSVGLEIHENPACNTRDTTPLKAGMTMTVEPGIYLENKFGVRIEDMVVVTENGCEDLTESPKELIIL